MSLFSLDNTSRKKAVKILAIGNYLTLSLDIIQGLVFVPIFLSYLGSRLYGLWLGTGGIIAALAFLDMGMATLCIQRVAREYGKNNYKGIGLYFFNGLLINVSFMMLLVVFGLVLSQFIDSFFDITTEENAILMRAFIIALLALVLLLINNTIEGTINSLQKPLISKINQILAVILSIITTYLVLVKTKSLLAIPIGLFVRSSLMFISNTFFLIYLFKKNDIPLFSFNRLVIKDYLKLSPSVFLSKLGTSLVSNIEPTLITISVSPEIAVFFSVTKKAGNLIRTILDRIGGIIYPSISHMYASETKEYFRDFFIKLINVLFPVSLIGFLMYILINKTFVSIWVNEESYLGIEMTILIGAALFFSFFSNISSYLISATGDIKFPSTMVFFESIAKLVLLYVLLNSFGIIGLPIATLIVSLFFLYIYNKRWKKHIKINGDKKQKLILLCIFNSVLFTAITILVYQIIKILAIKSMVVLIGLYLIVFLAFSIIILIQNRTVKDVINNKIKSILK